MPDGSNITLNLTDAIQGIVKGMGQFIDIIKNSTTATTLFVIGFVLLLITIICIRKILLSDAKQTPPWLTIFLFMCLVGSALFAASAAAISLTFSTVNTRIELDELLNNLRSNKRVNHLIRMIAYDPISEPYLSVGKITHLGKQSQEFTFVADYDELRGYTVSEAIRRTGGTIQPGQHVTAFIFPIPRGKTLRPVNARGLLQVIRAIENSQLAMRENFHRFDVDSRFKPSNGTNNSALIEDLSNDNVASYSWAAYSGYYTRYCEAAIEFKCNKTYNARDLIGEISADWHPLGFARRSFPVQNVCLSKDESIRQCESKDWKDIEANIRDYIGARVFLMQNMMVSDIDGRYMIEFTQPELQIIPIISVK